MWGLETIRKINHEAAVKAREARLEPTVLESEEQLEDWPPFPLPHLGDACADIDKENERVETLFVDSSGMGAENEPALTINQFKTQLKSLMGEYGSLKLAIEDQGQFQVHIAVWKYGAPCGT